VTRWSSLRLEIRFESQKSRQQLEEELKLLKEYFDRCDDN
jgi:hypothetical protein